MRDYTILHLLYDSGARASEIAALNLDYFDPKHQTLAILGKADRYRQMQLWPKTAKLIETYITKHRITPNRLSQSVYLSINAVTALPGTGLIESVRSI